MSHKADQCLLAYQQATNDHDIEAILSLIDEGAIYLFSDGSAHIGKPAVEKVLRYNFNIIADEVYSIDNLAWLVETEEVAVCVYDYSWTGLIKGEPASGSGRGTTILQCKDKGWNVVHEHLSKGKFAN